MLDPVSSNYNPVTRPTTPKVSTDLLKIAPNGSGTFYVEHDGEAVRAVLVSLSSVRFRIKNSTHGRLPWTEQYGLYGKGHKMEVIVEDTKGKSVEIDKALWAYDMNCERLKSFIEGRITVESVETNFQMTGSVCFEEGCDECGANHHKFENGAPVDSMGLVRMLGSDLKHSYSNALRVVMEPEDDEYKKLQEQTTKMKEERKKAREESYKKWKKENEEKRAKEEKERIKEEEEERKMEEERKKKKKCCVIL